MLPDAGHSPLLLSLPLKEGAIYKMAHSPLQIKKLVIQSINKSDIMRACSSI